MGGFNDVPYGTYVVLHTTFLFFDHMTQASSDRAE